MVTRNGIHNEVMADKAAQGRLLPHLWRLTDPRELS